MWLHQLEAMLPDGDPVGMTIDAMPGCCCRTIFRCLYGHLEVKGWASTSGVTDGDIHRWWRCTAVGLRIHPHPRPSTMRPRPNRATSEPGDAPVLWRRPPRLPKEVHTERACGCVQVRVRYHGYDETNDEWRSVCSLRRAATAADPTRWSKRQRIVGDEIEFSAPPCAGHPAALWEATIKSVRRAELVGARVPKSARPSADNPNRDLECLVHFLGFTDEFDEWVAASSTRLRTRGGRPGAACRCFGGEPVASASATHEAPRQRCARASVIANLESNEAAAALTRGWALHTPNDHRFGAQQASGSSSSSVPPAPPRHLRVAPMSHVQSCHNLLERDGGAFGCVLPAGHGGPHRIQQLTARQRGKRAIRQWDIE